MPFVVSVPFAMVHKRKSHSSVEEELSSSPSVIFHALWLSINPIKGNRSLHWDFNAYCRNHHQMHYCPSHFCYKYRKGKSTINLNKWKWKIAHRMFLCGAEKKDMVLIDCNKAAEQYSSCKDMVVWDFDHIWSKTGKEDIILTYIA